jgi:leader peptidase (prepilin peptidase)/N-methyltransferase
VTAVLVIACAATGFAAGWASDPVITRVPRRLPVRGPSPAEVPPSPPRRRAAVALVTAALCGGIGARFDDTWTLPAYLVVTIALVVLSVIDLEHYLLPNRIVYPTTVAALALFTFGALLDDNLEGLLRALLAGGVAFSAFFVLHVISPRSMGFGDVRLSFTLGLALGYVGWGEVFLGLFLGFAYGALVGIVLIAVLRRGRNQPVPFGPFLAAGTMTALLVGAPIITWYRGG